MVGDANSVHIHGFIKAMKQKDPELIIDVFAVIPVIRIPEFADNVIEIKLLSWYVKYINKGTRFIIFLPLFIWHRFFLKNYDTIFIHFIVPYYHNFVKYYNKRCKTLVSVFWGSDLFRIKKKDIPKVLKIVGMSDVVNLATPEMYKEFLHTFNMSSCIKRTNYSFGIEILNDIKTVIKKGVNRQRFIAKLSCSVKITAETKIVTIGYNGAPQQQHLKIIEDLENREWRNTLFIFPITYAGTKEYHSEIKRKLERSSLNWILIPEFMTNKQISNLRFVTDVFIQLQTTDGLSVATQEHIFAGNRVIVGSWLPYKMFKEMGIFYQTVDTVSEISEKLKEELSLGPLSQAMKDINRNAIAKFSDWEYVIEPWLKL